MRKWHLSASWKATGIYDDCKKKPAFSRTIIYSQNFIMVEKSKKWPVILGRKSPGAFHGKDRKKRTESQATFMPLQH